MQRHCRGKGTKYSVGGWPIKRQGAKRGKAMPGNRAVDLFFFFFLIFNFPKRTALRPSVMTVRNRPVTVRLVRQEWHIGSGSQPNLVKRLRGMTRGRAPMLVKRSFEGLDGGAVTAWLQHKPALRLLCAWWKTCTSCEEAFVHFHRYPVLCCTVHSCIFRTTDDFHNYNTCLGLPVG